MKAHIAALLCCGLITVGYTSDAHAGPSVEEHVFGKTKDGSDVKLFTLRNSGGVVAKVMTFGATLTELQTPDRKGNCTNILLGSDRWEQYRDGFPAPASVMGRVANRIANARFTLDGVEYKLPANAGRHQIHGGQHGFGTVLWQGKALPADSNEAAVEFTYISRDGEEGYPGNLTITIKYTLTDKDELRLDYTARANKATPLNVTSHAYFNLAGHGDVLGHELWIAAGRYTIASDDLIPTGEIASVKNTPVDFTTPTKIGAHIGQLKPPLAGYDHNFILGNETGELKRIARVFEPTSGRVMEVFTTEPAVQLYTANHLNGSVAGIGGVFYPKHGALCLETQHYPDSVNHPNFPSTILRPGKTFRSTTIYKFSQ